MEPKVDRDNPWPGLAAFTEDMRGYFFGRERETAELVRLVRRSTLTVLFGQSGLGKSSLLQAGVFPLLREADFLPLYLRLDNDPSTPPLADQVKAELVNAFWLTGADAPAPRADETLWEYFHRRDIDIWSAKNRLLTPVLAFDQFEEIFTVGRADDLRRKRGRAFLTELADLVENRPPASLSTRFDSGELDTLRYAFDKPSCQVILSVREDFLPDLEGLKGEMGSLMLNRMRLRQLTGTQALEIVARPAPHLLADGVAERVVEFVAGGRGGSAERLEEFEVEPSLLSVICRELNQRRRAMGQERITCDLVSGNRREILHDFYERSVADLPAPMREFIEDRLLTKSGFRDNLALETALEAPGVTRPLVDALVLRRLLRIEDRLGVQRVELTHDVLADVIRASRDSRKQRLALERAEAQELRHHRRVWWLRALSAGLILLLAGVSILAYQAVQRAVKARNQEATRSAQSDIDLGSQLLEGGNATAAVAHFVRAARTDPANPVVGTRLISALARRSWPVWRDTGIKLPSPGRATQMLPGGRQLLILGEDGVVRQLDAKSYGLVREVRFPAKASLLWAGRRGNSDRFAVLLDDGGAAVTSVSTGETIVVPRPEKESAWVRVALSPDGKWLALAASSRFALLDAKDGRIVAQNPLYQHGPASLNFSPDSSKLVFAEYSHNTVFLSVPAGKMLLPPVGVDNAPGATYADFSPDGTLCVMCWWKGARLYNAVTGATVGPILSHDLQCEFAQFDADGRRLLTSGNDGTVRIWDVATQQAILPPLHHGAAVRDSQLSRNGRFLVDRSVDDTLHVWDTTTGTQIFEASLKVGDYDGCVSLDADETQVLFCAPDGRLMSLRAMPSALRPVTWMPPGSVLYPSFPRMGFLLSGPPVLYSVHRSEMQFFSLETLGLSGNTITFPSGIECFAFDPQSRLLVMRTPGEDFSLWGLENGLPTKIRDLVGSRMEPAQWAEFVGAGLVAIGDLDSSGDARDHHVRFWREADGQSAGPTLSLPKSFITVNRHSVNPDGTRVTLGMQEHDSYFTGVWEIATGRQLMRVKADAPGETENTKFSPDGKLIAEETWNSTPDRQGGARLWDARTGEPRSQVFRHPAAFVAGEAFSDDGTLVAFGSGDGTVDVVSTATGMAMHAPLLNPGIFPLQWSQPRFVGPTSIVTAAVGAVTWWDARSGLMAMEPLRMSGEPLNAFDIDPGGRYVALIGNSGRATIWAVPPRYEGKGIPAWLPRLARALAGQRLDDHGALVPAQDFAQSQAELAEVRRELSALPEDAPYVAWGRWILADPSQRPIAPGLNLTISEARARGLTN